MTAYVFLIRAWSSDVCSSDLKWWNRPPLVTFALSATVCTLIAARPCEAAMAAAPSSSARRTVSGAFLRACGLGPFSGAAPSTRSRGPPPRDRVACQEVLACGALWPRAAIVTSLPVLPHARRQQRHGAGWGGGGPRRV